MKIRSVSKKLLKFCPQNLQNHYVRKTIEYPVIIPSRYVFKIAETPEELNASFRLVYDCYLSLGYCGPNSSKTRSTIHHTLSTTTTLIVLDGKTVIGTLTIVRDNILKLPLEKIFNIENLRRNGENIVEITSLAIHPDYRRKNGGEIFLPLLKFMHNYLINYCQADQLVISIHPKDELYYKSLFLCKRIPGTRISNFLNVPLIALQLNLGKAKQEYFENYHRSPFSNNLYNFFYIQREFPNFRFPIKTTDIKEDRGQRTGEEILLMFGGTIRNNNLFKRDDLRFDVDLTSIISSSPDETLSYIGKVKDVSVKGFRFCTDHSLSEQETFTCKIRIGKNDFALVVAKITWKNESLGYGFTILQCDQNWKIFINELHENNQKEVM